MDRTDLGDRQAVAAQLRQLASVLVTSDASGADWQQAGDHLAAAVAALAPAAQPESNFARSVRAAAGVASGDPVAGLGTHPLGNATSGVYPPLQIHVSGQELSAEVQFGPAFEGPPGLVHGGFVAAGFDITLSVLASFTLGASVTRRLELRYHRPTFLDQPLRYEIRQVGAAGRLAQLEGRLLDRDGRVTTKAKAEFASVSSGRFAERPQRRPSGPSD